MNKWKFIFLNLLPAIVGTIVVMLVIAVISYMHYNYNREIITIVEPNGSMIFIEREALLDDMKCDNTIDLSKLEK